MILAKLRRPPAAFLINGAITRPATGTITFGQPFPSYMQSFIKIRGAVLEKNANKAMTLCNFNKDVYVMHYRTALVLDQSMQNSKYSMSFIL